MIIFLYPRNYFLIIKKKLLHVLYVNFLYQMIYKDLEQRIESQHGNQLGDIQKKKKGMMGVIKYYMLHHWQKIELNTKPIQSVMAIDGAM